MKAEEAYRRAIEHNKELNKAAQDLVREMYHEVSRASGRGDFSTSAQLRKSASAIAHLAVKTMRRDGYVVSWEARRRGEFFSLSWAHKKEELVRTPVIKGLNSIPSKWDAGEGDPAVDTLHYWLLREDEEPQPTNEPLTEKDLRDLRRERIAGPGQWYWEIK